MIDWITGEKFIGIADLVFYPQGAKDCNPLENTFCECMLKEKNIVYTHTLYVKQLFKRIAGLKCEFIIITHNCDENVNESYLPLPDNVKCWFTTNVAIEHPKIQSIPIGLENDRWFKKIGKKEKMYWKLHSLKGKYKNTAYLNVNTQTNPKEREPLYTLFGDKKWVTKRTCVNGNDFEGYINDVYTHRFVFCPDGNGIDTHRLWETLYMRSIPICKKGVNISFYSKELPIVVVNDWEEIEEIKLLNAYCDLHYSAWNHQMLTFEYWKNKILSHV